MTLLSLLVCGPGAAQTEDPADIATARGLFREGLELSKQEKWEEARIKLGQSLALKEAALTYYTLAVADKRSGHLVAALEHFRGFLAQPITDKTEAFIEPAREAVDELEKRVAGVTITIKPAGVPQLVVRLDGDDIPLSALERRRLIDPGEHTVTAEAKGYIPHSQKIVVAEGASQELLVTLKPAPEVVVPPPQREFPVVPVVLLASGGAVGIAGLVLGIIGVQEAEDAQFSDDEVADAALTKTVAGDILMGVGGAAAAVGLVLLIVHYTTDVEPTQALQPWISPNAAGIQIRF